jgi:putative redox protein
VYASRALAEAGITTLRFDLTGVGDSEGPYEDTTVSTQIDDVRAAVSFLTDEVGKPALLIGISLGGVLAIHAVSGLPGVRAVATINSPSDTVHLRKLLLDIAPALEREATEVTLFGRTTRIGPGFISDLSEHDTKAALAALDRPLLITHATEDRVVPLEAAARLFGAAYHPKSFVAVDGVDHLLLGEPEAAAWLGRVIAAWARRYTE